MDLLRWFRFLWAVGIGWDRATRVEARDFCSWLQVSDKPVRPHWRGWAAAVVIDSRRSRRAGGRVEPGDREAGSGCEVRDCDRGALRDGAAQLLRLPSRSASSRTKPVAVKSANVNPPCPVGVTSRSPTCNAARAATWTPPTMDRAWPKRGTRVDRGTDVRTSDNRRRQS